MNQTVSNVTLECGPTQVAARYQPGTGSDLVIQFHGALNREKREIPFFQSMFSHMPEAHQLSIFDPAISQFDGLAAGWYLGWQDAPLWDTLRAAIKAFSRQVGCTHNTYVGGSSGGLAALLYSGFDHGSTVVAFNPQTNIARHIYPNATKRYFSLAWPDALRDGHLDRLPLDAAPVLARAIGNTVIYLQNSSDLLHLERQALPFLSALPSDMFSRLVVDIRFEGVHGHGGSILRETVRKWVKASFAGRTVLENPYEAILDAKAALDGPAGAARGPTNTARGPSRPDLRMANKLAQWHLGQR